MFARHDPRHVHTPTLDLGGRYRPGRLTAFRGLLVGMALAVAAWATLLGLTGLMNRVPLSPDPLTSPLQTHLQLAWTTGALPALALAVLAALFGRVFLRRLELRAVACCAMPWMALVGFSLLVVQVPDGGGTVWTLQPLWIWQWLPLLLAVPLGLAVGAAVRSASH